MHESTLRIAKQSLAIRERRGAMFRHPTQMPSGCWDLLLLLYVVEVEGDVVSRRAAAVRCNVSTAIFDRWVAILAKESLVRAEPSAESQIELTDEARDKLVRLLESAARD